MTDNPATPDGVIDETDGAKPDAPTEVERQAFLDRLNKESTKRKEASERAAKLEKELADVTARLQERDDAGLPELERERKRAEQLEARLKEADARAEKAESERVKSQRERLVLAAASKANFDDPSDALRYSDIINLDDIEDPDQAERAVKRLAKAKPRLLKDEESGQPQIGRVLEGGKTAKTTPAGDVALDEEAQMVSAALRKFVRS